MKHPNSEEWMAFVYDEIENTAEKSRLSAHLQDCGTCRQRVQKWRGAMTALDADRIVATTAKPARPWIRWAAAAALFISGGVVFSAVSNGKVSAQTEMVAELRARLEKSEAENAKTRRLLTSLADTVAANQADNQQAILATVRELRGYRKDLETVAALTQEGLNSTEKQLLRLASYNAAGAP